MKKNLFAVIAVLLILVGSIAATCYTVFNPSTRPFYVGVTYGGSSIEEAKELVDKVKDCTNLFVLQSGSMQGSVEDMKEIGDYVVASNMSYAVSSSVKESLGFNKQQLSSWLIEAKKLWGDHFIGIYYNDEPGGHMLDSSLSLEKTTNEDGNIIRVIGKGGGSITVQTIEIANYAPDDTAYISGTTMTTITTTYVNNGEIILEISGADSRGYYTEDIKYYPNGTITIEEYISAEYNFYTSGNITKYSGSILIYEELLKQNPIQNYDDAANAFVNMHKDSLEVIDKKQLNKNGILVFTADYGLYWWDYKGGYDFVLAELGWNHSDVQHIGLVRGVANFQGKSWGTIFTWKYTQAPFLADGKEMFEQMKLSYEAGAEYVIIFNYSEDPANPNTLLEEHFLALERFWDEVVQNPEVIQGGIKAEAVLVLPKDYGWGMRAPNDNIWGIWSANDTTQEIWNQLQSKIEQYGLKLDIVFEDPNYSVTGKYPNIYYWNQK